MYTRYSNNGKTVKTVDDILENKTLTNKTGRVDNYISAVEGEEKAFEDFYSLSPINVTEYQNGTIVGYLKDGRIINIHMSTSLNGTVSLEIYNPSTNHSIKIRY